MVDRNLVGEVHLVADTNLFFECKRLEELPWSELGYDTVVILITNPIMDEIDKHKNGSGRTRQRALEIYQRIRDMLKASAQEVEIQASSPRVLLRRALPSVVPDLAHNDYLDYTKTDERLIGITSALSAKASGYDVRLFTDDTGPASTADGLRTPYLMIDESWRRPASETTEEKKIRDLQKDLATYRAQEPKIEIGRCEPADESNVISVVRKVATPLTEAEIEGFIAKLRLKHPLVTDFSPPQPSKTVDIFGTTTSIDYSAPAEADVTNYCNTLYPQWLEQCRETFRGLHEGRDEIEADIVLRWSMANKGTRPASKVRVLFETKGPLALQRSSKGNDDDEEETRSAAQPLTAEKARPKLLTAPMPPAFLKNVTRVPAPVTRKSPHGVTLASLRVDNALADQFKGLGGASEALRLATSVGSKLQRASTIADAALLKTAPSLQNLYGPAIVDQIPRSSFSLSNFGHVNEFPLPRIPHPPDPEEFYYDDWPTNRLVTRGVLTCDLWRHHSDAEVFEVKVLFTKSGEARGIVQCTVHAENLTQPEQSKVVVERRIAPLSMAELAEEIVESCD